MSIFVDVDEFCIELNTALTFWRLGLRHLRIRRRILEIRRQIGNTRSLDSKVGSPPRILSSFLPAAFTGHLRPSSAFSGLKREPLSFPLKKEEANMSTALALLEAWDVQSSLMAKTLSVDLSRALALLRPGLGHLRRCRRHVR